MEECPILQLTAPTFTAAGSPRSAVPLAITPDMVQAEHHHAMATLTPLQRQAIRRERLALNMACFTGEGFERRLRQRFEMEARERSRTPEPNSGLS